MTALGIGLIGTGYMGKCHALAWNAVAPTFGDVPSPRLVHLAEVDRTTADRKAAQLGFARASGDWRALVADPDVDVVSITTPNPFHAQMAIAALDAGKHVWCEKPMATSLADAEAMLDAARRAGRVAVLGYNYIQSPSIRAIEAAIASGAIGALNHLRIEMDEDFMADQEAPFGPKNAAASGYGALDDFAVHPLSLMHRLTGLPEAVVALQATAGRDRPLPGGGRRALETFDIATVLMKLAGGVTGLVAVNRAAWGRKGRLQIQLFGSRGTLVFDQERGNEFQLYTAEDPAATAGFRTILSGPQHAPYDRFVPAPGHGLGFNDLKVIEAREVMRAIAGEPARVIDFAAGLAIERTVHAMARSHDEGQWVTVG